MSRRWLTALLFVLAMTLQVVAPVANGVAAAHGLDGPGLGNICLGAAHDDHGTRQPGQGHHRHHHDCALCQAFCDGVAPVTSRATPVSTPVARWTLLSWSFAHQTPNASLRGVSHRARAPPVQA